MHIQLEQDSAICEIVNLSIKLSIMINIVKEIWDLFRHLFVLLFGFGQYVFNLNLILGSISFSESNMYSSELSNALGSGKFDCNMVLVWPCPSTWTGWTHCENWRDIKDIFICACSTFSVDSIKLSVSILEDSVAIFNFGNQVVLVNLGLLICGRSVMVYPF
jgi:hypothetical protein